MDEKLIEFYDRLEGEIVLASGISKTHLEHAKKSLIPVPMSAPFPNWLEQAVNSGYVALIETRNNLHDLFPELRAKSRTLKDHNVTYW